MDLSYSTDSWIDDARVLDTMRETLLCAGEVLDEFIEDFAVAGFSSNTRKSASSISSRIFGRIGEGLAQSWVLSLPEDTLVSVLPCAMLRSYFRVSPGRGRSFFS